MTYYLYKKTHKDTNLKYLGFTKQNPYKYKGSGMRWLAHVKKHGYNVDTEILLETADKSQIDALGSYYSNLWNVVESREWANLKPETGDGGGVPGMHKGKKRSEEDKQKMRQGWQALKENGYKPWNYGKSGFKGPVQETTFISPDGKEFTYESMKQGCIENNLIYVKMSAVKNHKLKHHKGWTIKR